MRQFSAILLLTLALGSTLAPCAEALAHALAQTESCGAEKSCCHAPPAEEQAAKATASHCGGHADGEEHGQCSPLCHCSCCGHVATIDFLIYPQFQAPVAVSALQPLYEAPHSSEYAAGVWQPPRRA